MNKYIQFDWQKIRITGKLKKIEGKMLYIANSNHKPKAVTPYTDDKGVIFIKNPYNKNWIDFLSCNHF